MNGRRTRKRAVEVPVVTPGPSADAQLAADARRKQRAEDRAQRKQARGEQAAQGRA